MKQKDFGGVLRQLDFFGVPVTFRVDGNHKFTTKLGGVFSIVFAITCLLYGAWNGYILFMKLETKFSQNSITNYYNQQNVINSVSNITDDFGKVAKKQGFNIAFGIFNDDLNLLPNAEHYFKIK